MIDIVLAAKSGLDDLKGCLSSIQKHTPLSDCRITIAVPDSGPAMSPDLIRADFPEFRLARTAASDPHALLNNLGFQDLDSAVFFIDSAMRVTEGWFSSVMETAERESDAGMMSFKLVSKEGLILSSDMRPDPRRVLFFKDRDEGQADYLRSADILPDFCFYLRAGVLKKISFTNPDQHDFCGLSRRVREAGLGLIYNGFVQIVYKNTELITRISEGMFNPDRKNAELLEPAFGGFPLDDSHPADRLMSAAIRALYDGDYERALQFSEQLETAHPELVELWVPALAHVRLEHYAEARVLLEVLVRRNPAGYSARNYMTLCLRQLGLDHEAGDFAERMFACIGKNIELKRSRAGSIE